MSNINNYLRESRGQEVNKMLDQYIQDLADEGLSVEFGKIGIRTTYALIHDASHDREIVGYTFLKDVSYYKEDVGKLKALQQALARKKLAEESK